MRRLLRWTRRLLVALFALVALAAAGVAALVWATLPDPDGAAEIPGLANPVAVAFDVNQVPTISARTINDAAAALGWLHARERLFQMDLMRRGASGRISALIGSAGLRADRYAVALDLPARAAADYQALPEATRALLDAYARGVNAWIAERGRLSSLEFAVLGAPEPWTAVDSLLWGKAMGLFLSGNFRTELARLRLLQRLPAERIEELWPTDATPGNPAASLPSQAHLDRLAGALPNFPADVSIPSHASNAWAVSPRHSATGGAILANDPHLAFLFPVLWYLVRVELPDRTIVGATAPGVPIMVLGQHTAADGRGIAWGFTTTHSDTQDLVIERVTQGRPDHYDTPAGPQPFRVRDVEIPVRFGESVRTRIRETRNGPVLSDVDPEAAQLAGEGHVLAVRMALLAPGDLSAAGLARLGIAHTIEEAEEALRQVASPMQNVMVADRAGRIGMFIVGKLPIRTEGDGAWPVPGWDGVHEWSGTAPWDAMPHVRDPDSGRIANANNRVAPPGHEPMIARDWHGDGRFRRIVDRLSSRSDHTAETLAAIQVDALSLPAAELKGAMAAGLAPADARARRALALLADWDGTMATDKPQPLIWNAWTRAFLDVVLAREGISPADWREQGSEFLGFVLARGQHWCGGDCTALRAETLGRALDRVAGLHGADIDAWAWGNAHQIRLSHPLLRPLPWLQRRVEAAFPIPGDASTVLRAAPGGGPSGGPGGFDAVHGAGFRGSYDLAEPSRSRFALAGGQSGHPFAAAATQLLGGWAAGQTIFLAPPPAGSPRIVLAPAP
jgi:penicillin amidase